MGKNQEKNQYYFSVITSEKKHYFTKGEIMKRFLLVVLLLCQVELASAKSGRSTAAHPVPVPKTAQDILFEGRSQSLDQASKNAIDITLPMYGKDPDEGLKEEAASDGISKCVRVYTYCKVLDTTFRRVGNNYDGSVYGVILVRGNNNAPEPGESNVSSGNSKINPSELVPPKGSICIFVPHSPGWFDFLDSSDKVYYEIYVYYADTGRKSKSSFDPKYRKLDEVAEIFLNYRDKGVCETYRIEDAE